MNPFLLSSKDRLNIWKEMRKSLIDMPENEQLLKVVQFWSQSPLKTIAYNVDEPNTWPTPWEMITANDWCRNTVAIGMDFTLRLSGWNAERLRLSLIIDRETSVMGMIVIVDEAFMLNYDWCVVLPKKNFLSLKNYKWNGKKYVNS